MTFGDAVADSTRRLIEAGVDSPRLDAELLLCDAVGITRAELFAHVEDHLDSGAALEFEANLARRIEREPLAYIRGTRSFRFLELICDARALVPRPETELLVEVAHELNPQTVLDVGTGSGAVGLAIASEVPSCTVVGTDTSAEALELARENALKLGMADRVRFIHGSVPEQGSFGLAVANLPYVREADWQVLAPEIQRYEPREALIGGPDGLDVVRAVASALAGRTDALALEIGDGQAPAAAEILTSCGFGAVRSRRDLAGIERVVVGESGRSTHRDVS